MVRQGRVHIDGVLARDPSVGVLAATVTLDGEYLDHPGGVLVGFHKPLDVVCSHNSSEGATVFELLPPRWLARSPRPEAVGRLDRDTTGLLIVTDDHALLHRLTSPNHHVPKTYLVRLDRAIDQAAIAAFASGSLLLSGETKPCAPADLTAHAAPFTAAVTITEGRYHQVRRMFGACGYAVVGLHRVRVGDWLIGDLAEGSWRDLNARPASPEWV